ncbi:hypothetical protein GCM10009682_41120 [Luedemannella flava]|uniref:non-specific serine/threonine protein kinase n=1 Tax=Luedemannella flava TaxID=349316 RepID=A0ABP4YME2_9ACTN
MPSGATVLADRYVLRERLGAGGMGEVWAATDELLGRAVAVKLILPTLLAEPDFLRRFLAEARAMASVQHSGVVAIHDFYGDATSAYLVMEYVQGEPLSRVLARVGRLAPEATMDLVGQAARALQAVHDRGIVHRDVKPGNLLVRPDGSLVLADFGIALGTAGTALTASGAILGTPAYLAPEQVLGQAASPRSDVYALGLVAYECLTGTRPFAGDNPFAVAMQRVNQPPPRLGPEFPPDVVAVVERALAPDPSLRWASAAELAAATGRRGVAGADPTSGRAVIAPTSGRIVVPGVGQPGPAAPPRRRGLVIGIAAAVVTVLLAGAGSVVWQKLPGGTDPGGGTNTNTNNGTGARKAEIPDGFVACGGVLCPNEPMCWHGSVQHGDKLTPPRPLPCTQSHYWETFAAVKLPADARTDRDLSHLMERADIQAVCSAKAMAEHSRDPAVTKDWNRDAVPIPADEYTILVHCLGGLGMTPGAVFEVSPR